MCGRYLFTASATEIAETFGVSVDSVQPYYNRAPSQLILAIRHNPQQQPELVGLRWGLIPSWADDPKIAYRLINARAETVADKPAFRAAFRRRRCLIPSNGFYEWMKEGKTKQPYLFRVGAGELVAFAGLWEHWQGPAGESIESCTILTTSANELVRPLHERMPVILQRADHERWLREGPAELLQSYPAERMTVVAVNPLVNSPRHDSPACIEPRALLTSP